MNSNFVYYSLSVRLEKRQTRAYSLITSVPKRPTFPLSNKSRNLKKNSLNFSFIKFTRINL
jgi:hypothetical protein